MTECDDELLTAVTKLSSDNDILAEFQTDDNELEGEDVINEPPSKRPSKEELCHAIDVLETFSLFAEVDIDSFKSNVTNISRTMVINYLKSAL